MVEAEDLDLVNSSSEEIKDFINNNLITLSS